jgi:cytidylate kinase
MDGRDIGSVVFPNAELKLFITASEEIRVERRFNELKNKGIASSKEEVRANLRERDYIDTHREISPLIQVPNAIVLDNTNLSRAQQLDVLIDLVSQLSGEDS